jgi:hypothetical protein
MKQALWISTLLVSGGAGCVQPVTYFVRDVHVGPGNALIVERCRLDQVRRRRVQVNDCAVHVTAWAPPPVVIGLPTETAPPVPIASSAIPAATQLATH